MGALAEVGARVANARLEKVAADEAVARLTRAVFTAAGKYRGLGMFPMARPSTSGTERSVLTAIAAIFSRGLAEGTFRSDLPAQTLAELYASLLEGAIGRMLDGRLGAEEASAAITTVFLDGARPADSQ